MTQWRRLALAELPALRQEIEAAPNVMALWIELESSLTRAYGLPEPDEDTISGIYRYAFWTLQASPDPLARTAVIVAFFEHLPTHDAVRADLHRWIDPRLFHELQPAFGYFLSESELEAFRREYRQRRAARAG